LNFSKKFSRGTEKMQIEPFQRLKIARQSLGLTLRDFAAPLGVTYQSVYNWEKGISPIPKMAAKAIENCFGLSCEWLLEGKGKPSVNILDREKFLSSFNDNDAFSPIPLVSFRRPSVFGFGADGGQTEVAKMLFDKQWLSTRIGISTNNLFLTEVEDDSMAPTLNPKDIVMADKTATSLGFMDGVWVFGVEDVVHIKRVQHLGYRQYQVTSDNSAYKPFILKKNVRLIGKVVWSEKRW
jgi:transcriptional regulator with XRE-family HTH domain